MEFVKTGPVMNYFFFPQWHQVFSMLMKLASETMLISACTRELLDM